MKIIGLVGGDGTCWQNMAKVRRGSNVGKDVVADAMAELEGVEHHKFANALRSHTIKLFGTATAKVIGHKERERQTLGMHFSEIEIKQLAVCSRTLQKELQGVKPELAENLSDLHFESPCNELLMNAARYLRGLDSNVFVRDLAKSVYSSEAKLIVISDVRQFNEYSLLKALDADFIEVVSEHAVAKPIDGQLNGLCEYRLRNDGSKSRLEAYAKEIAKQLSEPTGHLTCVLEDLLEYTPWSDWEYSDPSDVIKHQQSLTCKGMLDQFPFIKQ